MNKTFKVVFNKARGALMVVNEATSSVQKKGTKTVIAAAVAAMVAGVAGTAMAEEGDTPEEPQQPVLTQTLVTKALYAEGLLVAGEPTEKINFTGYGSLDGYPEDTEYGDAGGVFRVTGNGKLTVQHAVFTDNKSETGGAITVGTGADTLTVENSTFLNNHAKLDGGAIGNYRGMVITGAEFTGNTAMLTPDGEGKYITKVEAVSTSIGGGAISLGAVSSSGIKSISSTRFENNKSGFNGGAIATRLGAVANNVGGLIDIEASFTGNEAYVDGGAIYNTFYSNNGLDKGDGVTVTGYFGENKAGQNGGAIFNDGAHDQSNSVNGHGAVMTVYDSTFKENVAEGNGGAIASTGKITIAGTTTFEGNSAAEGGAIYIEKVTLTASDKNHTEYSTEGKLILDATAADDVISFKNNVATEENAGSDLHLVGATAELKGLGTISFGGSIAGDAASSITSSAAIVAITDASGFKGSYTVTGGKFAATNVSLADSATLSVSNATAEVTNLTNKTRVTLNAGTMKIFGDSINEGAIVNATADTENTFIVDGKLTNKSLFTVDNLIVNGTFDNQGMIGAVDVNKIPISLVNITVNDEGTLKSGINPATGNLLLFNQLTLNQGGTLELRDYATEKDCIVFEGGVELNLNGGAITHKTGESEAALYKGLVTVNGSASSTATTVNVASTYALSGLTLNDGATSYPQVNVLKEGGLTLDALTVNGHGALNVATGGKLTLTGTSTVGDNATFTNNGTITFKGGEFTGDLNGYNKTGTVVVDAGEKGVFTNKGQLDGKIFKLESGTFKSEGKDENKVHAHDHFTTAYWNGGEYYDVDLLSHDLNAAICDAGTDYLAGTKFTYKKADGSTAYLTKLEVKASDKQNDPGVGHVYIQAKYGNEQFKDITVSDGELYLGDETGTDAKTGSVALNTFEQSGGTTTVYKNGTLKTDKLTQSGGTLNVSGLLSVGKLDLTGGQTIIKEGGTLSTIADQVFTKDAGNGMNSSAGALKFSDSLLTFEAGSTLAVSAGTYSLDWKKSAAALLGEGKYLLVTGTEYTGPSDSKIDIDDATTGSGSSTIIHDGQTITSDAGNKESHEIDKNFGGSALEVGGSNVTDVTLKSDVTLTGSNNKTDELITVGSDGKTEDKTVNVDSKLNLGSEGSKNNTGTISTAVNVGENASLSVNAGDFVLKDVTATAGGTVEVKGEAAVEFGQLTADNSNISLGAETTTSVDNLSVKGDSAVADVKGTSTIANLTAEAGTVAVDDENAKVTVNNMNLSGTAVAELKKGEVSIAEVNAEGGKLVVNDNTAKVEIENVKLSGEGVVELNKGDVSITEVNADGGKLAVADEGNVQINTMNLINSTVANLAQKVATKVEEVVVHAADKAEHVITGALETSKISVKEGVDTLIKVGTNINNGAEANQQGNIVIKAAESMKGLRFFLDPAYVDGGEVTDGSSLIYSGTTLDAKITVGENSYLVLGADSADNLIASFTDGTLKWGKGAGETLAAVYVGSTVTIDETTGGLLVDQTATAETAVANGSVTFGDKSVLVADASVAAADGLIKSKTITVSDGAKAVLVGDVNQDTVYKIATDLEGNAVQSFKNLVAGNAMWALTQNTDGTVSARLELAEQTYGNKMQGHALANAAMLADGDVKGYVDGLLTDETGELSALASKAELFDAAMNPIGALGVMTASFDRASELSATVREEAGATAEPRLWAKVSGGKTKLDGITTGGQSLNLKTTNYGLVIGGETPVDGTVIGAAFTGGSGDTKNDSVSGKNEFDYYGLTAYAQREVGGITLTGDIGATWLSSELKVTAADVKNDVDTTVYKLGVEGKKSFELANNMTVTPFVGLDFYRIDTDGMTTKHGANVESTTANVFEMPIGASFEGVFDTASGMTVKPSFTFAVVPTFGDKDVDMKTSYAAASSNYNFTIADDVKVRTNFAVNAETKNFRFGAHLGFEWGNEERQSFSGGVKANYLF